MSRNPPQAALERPDGVWLVHVVGEEGCHSWGRTIREAEKRIQEAWAAWTDFGGDELPTVIVNPPDDVVKIAREAVTARRQSEEAQDKAARAMASAACRLTSEYGLSRRDVADLLEVSFQRVQQLVS